MWLQKRQLQRLGALPERCAAPEAARICVEQVQDCSGADLRRGTGQGPFQSRICDVKQVPGSFQGRICDVKQVPGSFWWYQDCSGAAFVTLNRYQDCSKACLLQGSDFIRYRDVTGACLVTKNLCFTL